MTTSRVPQNPRSVTSGFVVTILALILLPWSAAIAQWDFGLGVDLGIVYTDNLRLAADDIKEEEMVYTVAPLFSLTKQSERLDANINYRPEAYFFSDASESDAVFHIVDASLTTAFVRDALFLYLSGIKFQSNGSTDEGFPTTNLPVTGNRVDSEILEFKPYWKQNLGIVDILVEFTYRDSRYEPENPQSTGASQQDDTQQAVVFNVNNHSRRQGFAWGLAYDYIRVEYDLSIPFEYQTASANLGYWLNGTTRLFVSAGVETPFDAYFDPAMEDEFYEGGFQYIPNQRLDLEIAVGKRSFGNTVRGRFSYKLRRGQTNLTYEEGAQTRAELFAAGRRPLLSSDNLDGFLDRPGESDRFIRKRGEWLTSFELAKSDVTFRLFSEQRDRRRSDAGDALDDEQLAGAAFRWAWRLGVNTTLGFDADLAKFEIGDTEDSNIRRFSIDYTFQFSQRVGIVLAAQNAKQSGNNATFTRNYTENNVSLNLHARLQ